jgi:hypothetical protein
MLLKTPYGQKLASYVTQADPSFESGNATARVQTRKDFEAGGPNSVAGTITAGNTAIQHLGQLSDTIEELGKSDTGIPLLNMGKNAIGTATGGAIPVVQFNNIMGKLAEELTKFYRGTGGDQADVARDLANFNPSMSLPQLRAATQTVAGLVASKVNALQDRWHTAMGPNVPDFPIVQPHSAQALSVVQQRGGAPAASADVAPAAPGGAPPVATVKTPADVAALPSGTRFLIPDGSGRIGVAP